MANIAHEDVPPFEETKVNEKSDDIQQNNLTPTLIPEDEECWWGEDEDARVRRKLDIAIVPLLCVSYVFAFLDRSNIGNAKTAGMNKDLKLTDAQYQWLLTIFYISYIIFQVGVLGYKLFPPSKWMGSAVICWGVVAILQATAFNWSSLMAARFFVGMSEAAFGTGVALYLSFFYPRREVGLRFAWFLVGSAIASAIAGSVAYGLQKAKTSVESWRLIFIVEAAPTILIGVLIFFLLPDSIAKARFLTPHERKVAEARLYRARIDVGSSERDWRMEANNGNNNVVVSFIKSKLDISNFFSALKDPISYVNASLLFIVNIGYSSIPVYLPTILQGMRYTSLRAQAFSAPPYVGAFIVAIIVVYISDRIDIRGCWIVVVTIIGAAGYLMLAITENDSVRYGAVWLVVIGLFTFIPLAYSWLIANSLGESKKGLALVLFGIVGQCGPILGTRLFPASEAPYYKKGMAVSAGVLLLGTLITIVTLITLFYVNHKKDLALRQQHLQDSKGSSSLLQYQLKLDLRNPAHRQELHRRRQDIAEYRERSVYFRYSL